MRLLLSSAIYATCMPAICLLPYAMLERGVTHFDNRCSCHRPEMGTSGLLAPHWRMWVGLREQKSRKKKKKRRTRQNYLSGGRWMRRMSFGRGVGYFQTKGSRGNEGSKQQRSETPTSFHCVDPGNENQGTTPGRRPPLLPFPWSRFRFNNERQQSAQKVCYCHQVGLVSNDVHE